MKDYKDVIAQRYERDKFDANSIEQNMYSLINDIGYRIYVQVTDELRHFIKLLIDQTGKRIDEVRVLDIGCGTGVFTRLIAEMLCNPKQVIGMDYCENRVTQFRKMNPEIMCVKGDIVELGGFEMDEKVDGIVLLDCLMHLRKDEDVRSALEHCYYMLNDGGMILWHDPNTRTHFDNYDSDGEGFSCKEMDEYCKHYGFELVEGKEVFKKIPFCHTNTLYYSPKSGLLKKLFLEQILPTRGAVNTRIYRKK